jgi:transposase InsO family protein
MESTHETSLAGGLPLARAELRDMWRTVERIMRHIGLQGVRRGKVVRTTIPDNPVPCPLDRVKPQFRTERPNQLWVMDSK